jgi:hypothetical protein
MDFTALIKKSFSFAWNNRVLWLFGFLSGGVGGVGLVNPSGFSTSFSGSNTDSSGSQVQGISKVLGISDSTANFPSSQEWLVLVLLIVALVLVLLVVVIFVTNWAGAALVYSILQRNQHRPTFSSGSQAGLKYWWKFYLLALVFALAVFAFLAMLAIPVVLLFLSRMETLAIISLIVAAGVFLIFIFVLSIAGSLVIMIAQRLIIHKSKGVLESIRLAGGLIKNNIGESILTWLLAIGLNFAAGFVAILALLPIVAVLVVLFIINIWVGLAITIPALIIVFIAAGFWQAFLATYWTLFYEYLIAKEGW